MGEQSGLAENATRHSGGPRGGGKRAGRFELLPSGSAVHDGGGTRRKFDLRLGRETLSAGRLASVHRLRLLSGVASEKMPKPAERDHLRIIVGVRNFCRDLGLLSSGDGERGGRAAGRVNS
jgi:hypothetical protein